MSKNLLAAAITAGLMAPGMAAADVKIFGTIQAETGNVEVDPQGGGGTDTTKMGNSGSGAIHGGGSNQIGFKGTEKLGNGMTAYFKYNNQFSTFDRNTGGWNARDVFVGVKGDGWHTQFGTMNSRYKTLSHKYDPFHGTGAQARAQMHSTGFHNGYADNVMEVGFKSGGWDGGIQVTWEDSTNNSDSDGRGDIVDAGSWNGSIKYKQGNWEAGFAYIDLDYGSGGGGADSWKVAGKYSGNGWSVGAQYEDADTDNNTPTARRPDGSQGLIGFGGPNQRDPLGLVSTSDAEFETFLIAATYDLSDSTTLLGRYGQGDYDDPAANGNFDIDHDGWAIGVKHNMSKRTYVYGGYMGNDYDYDNAPDVDVDAWLAGLIHKF